MSMHLRYSGRFKDRYNNIWRIELLQEADSAFSTVGELSFDANPLEIEWAKRSKEEVICGSSATLRVISPGDRTYEDLYTIQPGTIRMDVYRNDLLTWSGVLDPEFYEEPYERYSDYVVELTFSDLGILSRKKFALSGMQTLRQIVDYCISESGINTRGISTSNISTTIDSATNVTGALSIRSDNFYDEDGEAMTLDKVLEGILQPLALKIIQRGGLIYLYDINSLCSGGTNRIRWTGATQTMGVDKVINNVNIRFSPYGNGVLMSEDDFVYNGKYGADRDLRNLTSGTTYLIPDYGEYYSYYPDYDPAHSGDYDLIDFTIFISNQATGLAQIGSLCSYFHILPIIGGGQETSGVVYAFTPGYHGQGWGQLHMSLHRSIPRIGAGGLVLKTKRVFIPKIDVTEKSTYYLRLVEEILIDARYNPISGNTEYNEEANDDAVKKGSAWVFIPAKVTLYSEDGTALYHYKNSDIASGAEAGSVWKSKGSWIAGADPGNHCYLEYYKAKDLADDAGIRGWSKNRQCIGRPDGAGGRGEYRIYDSFLKMPDGQYIPYPPVAGYIEIQILEGFYGYDYKETCEFGSTSSKWDRDNIYDKFRWCLYKTPTLEIVDNDLVWDVANSEDKEYNACLNTGASEELNIDTICGTVDKISPAARGLYYKTADGLQLRTLSRAGRTDSPENLLIGTLYSQYAERKTMLSGEGYLQLGLTAYSEACQGNKRFMIMSEVQRVADNSSDIVYCEIAPDEYDNNS